MNYALKIKLFLIEFAFIVSKSPLGAIYPLRKPHLRQIRFLSVKRRKAVKRVGRSGLRFAQ
ncbi:MAG TPA: hypothetical protein DDZ96_14515 [Porphyromonadaceae bacterium]|jgi:hypothetical protein|nr:hypothetical protein [Porphyromonadaceae bacterium]HBL35005.1 hypothetical protein [Porphyromonadaceae bacterium]HBX19229.1 hypothetical protein [Porphyromonadaceae bacterium]HBX44744.1 hypothetical protein [Porphyromonadaceae bacterium]HCM21009.1 hypothetical protein [Porphyromonadaceae bacterium]